MGDRFFYDLKEFKGDLHKDYEGTKRFTVRQLNSIRKTSIARILCDNTDMTEVQPQAFRMVKSSRPLNLNKKRSCEDYKNIPRVDFEGFREDEQLVEGILLIIIRIIRIIIRIIIIILKLTSLKYNIMSY